MANVREISSQLVSKGYVSVKKEWTAKKRGRQKDSGYNGPYPLCLELQPHPVEFSLKQSL